MPTYEYQCPNGHRFELFQRMSDPSVAQCPECGAESTRRISGGAGVIFKGSGFYITDYGKDGKGPRKESAESSGSATESKPDVSTKGGASEAAKPESKPAAPSKPDSPSST